MLWRNSDRMHTQGFYNRPRECKTGCLEIAPQIIDCFLVDKIFAWFLLLDKTSIFSAHENVKLEFVSIRVCFYCLKKDNKLEMHYDSSLRQTVLQPVWDHYIPLNSHVTSILITSPKSPCLPILFISEISQIIWKWLNNVLKKDH